MARRGFPPRPRRCDDCGKIYTQKTKKQVRCAECQKKHLAERAKQKQDEALRKTDYKAWLIKHDESICKKVKTCGYGLYVGGIWICDYLNITCERRPCPVIGCKVFKRRQGNEKANNSCCTFDRVNDDYSFSGVFDIEQEVKL